MMCGRCSGRRLRVRPQARRKIPASDADFGDVVAVKEHTLDDVALFDFFLGGVKATVGMASHTEDFPWVRLRGPKLFF